MTTGYQAVLSVSTTHKPVSEAGYLRIFFCRKVCDTLLCLLAIARAGRSCQTPNPHPQARPSRCQFGVQKPAKSSSRTPSGSASPSHAGWCSLLEISENVSNTIRQPCHAVSNKVATTPFRRSVRMPPSSNSIHGPFCLGETLVMSPLGSHKRALDNET